MPFVTAWVTDERGDTAIDQPRVSALSIELLPVEAATRMNSNFPRSVNDGGAWLGRGLNHSAAAGVRAQWRFLTVNVAPEFFYQQNDGFTFTPSSQSDRSQYANPYHPGIDYPSRFGDDSFSTLNLGQSYVKAVAGPISLTFGRENLWIGAADVYPILLSYTAPGFSHLRIGTQKPLDLRVLDLELHVIFASLSESEYFDTLSANNDHYFTTTMAVIKPHFLPGLSIGVARAYHDTAQATGQNLGFYLDRLIETPFGGESSGNRVGNAIGVLLARWVLPESGFEAYAEWSREDTPGGWEDVLREPDWTQAYVLGFQKVFAGPNRLTRFYGELIHLGESAPARAGRGFFSYYTHAAVSQGHTNRGQLLGAAIGPGSDAQLLGVDIFSASGRSAFRIERTRYDDDTYYRAFARRFGETAHDAEITLSASRTHFAGPIELEAGLSYSYRHNRVFLEGPNTYVTNWGTRLGLAWRPPRLKDL
jgi:hypothetical protein